MTTTFADAFARAGLPTGSVAFASACHDLARLSLNREPDPRRAIAVWIGMTNHQGFQRALLSFLETVAAERATPRSVEDAGQPTVATHDGITGSSTDTTTGDERDHTGLDIHAHGVPSSPVPSPSDSGNQSTDDAQIASVSKSDGTFSGEGDDQVQCATQWEVANPSLDSASEGSNQGWSDTQGSLVAPLAHRGPTPEQIRAVTAIKTMTATMSGIYISERQGSRTRIEDVTVASLGRRLTWYGKRAAKYALEYNILLMVKNYTERQAFVSPGASVGDITTVGLLRQFYKDAQAHVNSELIQVPEKFRQELAA